MKFHCERCSTKYSISDDRVRGKILKIRCKNCSDVITVRDPAAKIASKRAPSVDSKVMGTTKAKGLSKHSQSPSQPEDSTVSPPESLEAEWYLSEDGEQEGPFNLKDAKAWVEGKATGSELYCWSEGFDDWLPVEKVSHFRGIRSIAAMPATAASTPAPGQSVSSLPAANASEPKPLFAATMAALGDEPETVEDSGGVFSSLLPVAAKSNSSVPEVSAKAPALTSVADPIPVSMAKSEPGDSDDLDFEIGEASRIVDLPALLAQGRGAMAPALTPSGALLPGTTPLPGTGPLPGTHSLPLAPAVRSTIGVGTGPEPVLAPGMVAPGVGVPPSRRKRAGLLLPLLLLGGALIVAITLLIVMSGGDDDSGKRLTRGSVGGSDRLGYNNTQVPQNQRIDPKAKVEDLSGVEPGSDAGSNVTSQKNGKRNGGKTPKDNPTIRTTPKNTKVNNNGEVDLSGAGRTGPTGPLDGDDLMRTYRKNQIALKMCYERSLKRNPLLKVPKTWVNVKVSLSGKVTNVTIDALRGTDLGQCLLGRIKRWKFRQTTEVFNGRFLVLFDK